MRRKDKEGTAPQGKGLAAAAAARGGPEMTPMPQQQQELAALKEQYARLTGMCCAEL